MKKIMFVLACLICCGVAVAGLATFVEIALIDRPAEPSLGAGEAVAGPMGAAIANAVFAATGARVRELPISAERLRGLWRDSREG